MQEELQHINLEEGDRILFLCNARKVNQVREAKGVDLGWDDSRGLETLEQRDVQIVEGMIANNSEFAGLSLSELKLRQRFNIFVLAIHRQGKNITDMGPNTKLAAGDTLLLEGPQEGMNRILTKQRIIPLSQRPAEAHNRSKQGWAILAMGLFIFIGLLGSFEQYGNSSNSSRASIPSTSPTLGLSSSSSPAASSRRKPTRRWTGALFS